MAPIVSPVSESVSQIKGITRNSLMKRLLRESGLGDYGTATAGDTNYLDDTTKLKSSQYSSDEWVDGWTRIAKDNSSVGSSLENSVSPITTYDPTTNGRVNFVPSFGTAIAVSDEYELWKFPNPKTVVDLIDQCLKNDIYLPCWSPLSEIPDFDMEQSGTTDWASSNATVTKQTASTSNPGIRGLRFLRVVSTSADGYARAILMNVEPGKEYFVSALVRCGSSTTTAKLIAYDETNSASIDNNTAITRMNIVRIWFTFTAPSTCYQVSIRLSNPVNSTTTEWDDVIFFCTQDKEASLPWWVEDREQVKGVFKLSTSQLTTDVETNNIVGDREHRWDVVDTSFGSGKLLLKSRLGTLSSPLFIFGVRNETAFSNDNTDIKLVDEDLLVACVLYRLFSILKNEPREGLLDSKFFQEKYIEWERKWNREQYRMQQRINQIETSPASYSFYSHRTDDLGWS